MKYIDKYKKSQFNICYQHPLDNDYLVIFNTKNSAQIIIDKNSYLNNDLIDKERKILIENNMLIQSDKNEFKEYLNFTKNFIVNDNVFGLVLFPTLDCNLNCTYCFQHDKTFSNDMSIETIDKLLNDSFNWINEHKLIKINITFLGGEPTLRPDLLNYFINSFNSKNINNIKYTCNLVTNGVDLRYDTINDLIGFNLQSINVTIDGTENIHNKRRIGKHNKNTFKSIIESVNKFSNKINFLINVVLDNENIDDIENLVISLNTHLKYKSNIAFAFFLNHFAHKNINWTIKKKENITNAIYQVLKAGYKYHLPGRTAPCIFYRKHSIVYGPDGKKYKCMNHVHTQSFSVTNLNKVSELKFESKCEDCEFLYLCNSSCVYLAKLYGENDFYCQKEEISLFIEAFSLAKLRLYEND